MWFKTNRHSSRYLDSHEHLVLGRAQVVALCQEDFAERAFAQLPLQDDVPPLDVLDD